LGVILGLAIALGCILGSFMAMGGHVSVLMASFTQGRYSIHSLN